MKPFDSILGNDELRLRLANDIREKTLSHAYIIEGPRGVGKHTLSINLAAALACENALDPSGPLPCLACPSCRKILSGKSPDIITVRREEDKASMGVDIIRDLRSNVRLLPNDLDTKVYIIEDAHLMNEQAQNAFLLTLEEPPKFVVFLLLAENSVSLLETIKSRAPILRMRPIPEDAVAEHILKSENSARELKESSPEEFDEIIKLSGGFIGQALELLDEKTRRPLLAARHMAKSFILQMTERKNGKKTAEMIESFSKKRDELSRLLSEIELAARDLLIVKKSENAPLCFFTSEDEAAELSFKFNSGALMELLGNIFEAKERLRANSNVRLTLFELAIKCGLL